MQNLFEKEPLWRMFASQFVGTMPAMIEVAGLLAAVLGSWVDFWIILALLMTNAILGFIEEIVRQMASAEGLPSFAEAETLVDHFSERMFSQEHITDKRRQLWNVLREEYEKRHGVALGLDA